MRTLDWIVLIGFVLFTVIYGIVKGRGSKTTRSYMLADRSMPWYAVALSIMATQASAITFVSTTGQGYADGLRFVQFYFGLPVAMVILCIVAVPVYHRLNVYTAYEYLERRFDVKTRAATSLLFLVNRSLSTGLSLYASAIIVATVMGWPVSWTLRAIGLVVILYTTLGGVKGVNWNDFQQFLVIMTGMVAACLVTIHLFPPDISLRDAVSVAGAMGKLKAVDFSFDWQNRYNFWSGLIGGTFLALSYFGADQSQVQRYLTGKSVAQSRLGLLFNGLAKIPMQFFILFVGVMVFLFYQFVAPPLFFNPEEVSKIRSSTHAQEYHQLELQYDAAARAKEQKIRQWMASRHSGQDQTDVREELIKADQQTTGLRKQAADLLQKNDPKANTNDTNYVFLSFVLHYLPAGLVGLVVVVIFGATMASTSSALNSLATATVVDIYKRLIRKEASDHHYLNAARWITVFWGLFAVVLSERASHLGTLVEVVNILGSLFYGTILGIFVLGFFFKRVGGTAAFIAAILGEGLVLTLFEYTKISFLWYNVFGCLAVVAAGLVLEAVKPIGKDASQI
jgi:SSS family transporter